MRKLESSLGSPLSAVFIRFPLLRNWKKISELGVIVFSFILKENSSHRSAVVSFHWLIIRFHLLWTKLVWRVRAHRHQLQYLTWCVQYNKHRQLTSQFRLFLSLWILHCKSFEDFYSEKGKVLSRRQAIKAQKGSKL